MTPTTPIWKNPTFLPIQETVPYIKSPTSFRYPLEATQKKINGRAGQADGEGKSREAQGNGEEGCQDCG